MEESLKTIADYIPILVPIFIFLLCIWFYQTMHFISWIIAELDKEDEAKYLRLKAKFEKKEGDRHE